MSREELGNNNSCTREEVILQYRPASEFLFFPLVWEGRSVVVTQVVSLNFRLLHVTHIQTVGKLLVLVLTHTHTAEKLRMLLRAYYIKNYLNWILIHRQIGGQFLMASSSAVHHGHSLLLTQVTGRALLSSI